MTRERLKSPRVRLFIALEVPDLLLDPLVEWRARQFGQARLLRPVPRESLHVTLAFLGYQAARDIEKIAETAFRDDGAPFELHAEKLVAIPSSRPRLYALALAEGGGALSSWQHALVRRLERERLYEPEKRPFWPHLTFARVKRGREREAQLGDVELPAELARSFRAERVTLYKSTLTRHGAEYEELARIELA